MTQFQIESAKVALKEMMDGGHFSISVIDRILKMTGGVPNHADYQALSLLHCVDFKKFTPAMRVEFPGILQRVLESPSMEINVTFKALNRVPNLIDLTQRQG